MAADIDRHSTNPLVWLLSLFVLAGAATLGLPRGNDSPPTSKPAEEAGKESRAEGPVPVESSDPLGILRDYLRVEPTESAPASDLKYKLTRALGQASVSVSGRAKAGAKAPDPLSHCLALNPMEYEFLIVTVPDPLDSRFPHEFDAVVDSIQRAFEARNMIIRLSQLPWPRKAGRPEQEASRTYRETPGVLLFRESRKIIGPGSPPPKVALVCLVGESPISGVHMPALTRALKAREDLVAALAEAESEWAQQQKRGIENNRSLPERSDVGVRIVAPYFSGSQGSLALALTRWAESHPATVDVVNGSATELRPELFRGRVRLLGSTVIPNSLITWGILQYLGGCRETSLSLSADYVVAERVALLREANTGYGAQANLWIENDAPDLTTQPLLDLPFPISVSQLAVSRRPGVTWPRADFVEPRLPLRDQNRLAAVPPYDPESAASIAGQGLRTTMGTIERTPVRYVGIVATDARDVVFLNRLMRSECPNVRVFTTEPNVALLHPDESVHMRGMVVGSTYPLNPAVQFWARVEGSPTRSIPFSLQSSQGYYNAILAHYGRHDLMIGYRPPKVGVGTNPSEPVAGPDGSPFDCPPIWISVVGQDGRMVPVHYYHGYDKSKYHGYDRPVMIHSASTPGLALRRPDIGIPLGVLLGALGAMLVLAAAIVPICLPGRARGALAGLTLTDEGSAWSAASLWVWCWRGVVLVGIVIFSVPYAQPVLEAIDPCLAPPQTSSWRHSFMVLAAYVVAAEVILLVVALGWRARADRPGAWCGNVALAAVVVAVTVLVVCCYKWDPVQRFLLYVRATDLSAGMSPLVPMAMLGAALFLLGLFGLRQANLARRFRLQSPFPKSWKHLGEVDAGVTAAFRSPYHSFLDGKAAVVLLCLAVPFLLTVFWDVTVVALPSDEGAWWDDVLRGSFWGAGGLVVLTLARFLTLWSRLGRLLEEVLRVPMVGAFERLPDEVGRIFGGYLYSMQVVRRRHLGVLAWVLPRAARPGLEKLIGEDYPALGCAFSKLATSGTANIVVKARVRGVRQESPPSPAPVGLGNAGSDYDLAAYFRSKAEGYFDNDLPPLWVEQSVNDAFGVSRPPERKPIAEDGGSPPGEKEKREKEEFVAAVIVLYLGQYFAQLRQLVWALVAVPPLLLFAAAGYPFQPDRPRLFPLVALLGAVVAGIVYVLYRINRDGLVSRISRTTPDRFTPDFGFLTSLTSYVLPVVAVMVLHLLGLFRFILEPILGLFL